MDRYRHVNRRIDIGEPQLMRIRNSFQFAWIFASILFVSAAQLLLKLAASRVDRVTFAAIVDALQTPSVIYLIGGLLCYLLSMACWLRALEKFPLSVTYPLLALSYPLVYLGALALPALHESLNAFRFAGMLLIMLGIAFLAPRARQ